VKEIHVLLGLWGSRPLLGPGGVLVFSFDFASVVFGLTSPFCPSFVNSMVISVGGLFFLKGGEFLFSHSLYIFVIEKIAPIFKPLGNTRVIRLGPLNNLYVTVIWDCTRYR